MKDSGEGLNIAKAVHHFTSCLRVFPDARLGVLLSGNH